jgi:ATP-binding protein involved in chromosome partitioning
MANVQTCQGDGALRCTFRAAVFSTDAAHAARVGDRHRTLQRPRTATRVCPSLAVVTTDTVRQRLARIRYPGFAHDIVTFGIVRDVVVRGSQVQVTLDVPTQKVDVLRSLTAEIQSALREDPGIVDVDVQASPGSAPATARSAGTRTPLPGIARIVAVASGKGGVGKSTVAVSLALGLHARGLRVGLLDADVHGPSVPLMTGAMDARPRMMDDKKIVPIERFGIAIVSMGFFLDDRSPVIWRGPMVMSIVRQFLRDVLWGELDVLVVDLPPGTGDAQLTLLQEVPVSGGVIVTTPQDVALQDVKRGIAMFQTVQTPVLGIVENMSEYVCPRCGMVEDLFGAEGGKREAAALGAPLLGQIPLVAELRASMDRGHPMLVADPSHPVSRRVAEIAERVATAIAEG